MAFKDSTDEKFGDQIGGSKLSLIQFSASWCGPCQQLKPIVEKISNDMSDKIDCYYHDIESQPNEPTKYSVRGVPTILLFKEGNPSGIKAFLSLKGYCENILRLPLTPVDKNLYDDIKEKIKIFDKKLL